MANKVRSIKGIPYEIVEDKVVLDHPEEGKVELPLELGRSAYSVAYAYLNRKTGTRRGGNGVHVVGNFTYAVDENDVMTITRKNGEVITQQLEGNQAKYPRTAAINIILSTLE